ncbi:NADH:quinone oxidoreductase I, membrane subunit M [Campylobacter blaseri]|uniref:NADH-quinone oxidoreductase subunit M n=1 Tax=Campylobacter blaseri TaxID=2042961 RepID=A0A2P8R121_9BACT|nr:NADH-quinone oxidoreductase subunit M [Campylobacter blaseri]PSM52171.1 NADH-quinone oxidoreductase subunit M [Campylobacter blaseri]PSM53937.1 NADH-quinone oxidoreductase subunit M [Campylobacter blaseri]QKF85373.1 NADH:quinone oxidoreductase I, membrane subunit M [Campylobacter blaseri]
MGYILSLVIVFPLIAALFAFIVDEKSIRAYSLIVSFIEFCFTILVWINFSSEISVIQMMEFIPLINSLNVNYHLGVDGISLFLIVLSSFIVFVSLISLTIKDRLKHIIISILFLEMTMMGVFLSLDAILFYTFWELSLLPMFYIIGSWGSGKRIYAAVKFFIYTFFGSMFMLVGILTMSYLSYKTTGYYSFNILEWQNLNLPTSTQIWIFLAFFIAFAIKTPMFPFHTWLPYAHGQAPTVGSILLAAILLKMGTYGFVRFLLPMFPDASVYFSDFISIIAIIMIIYTSFIAFGQKDIKQIIAYSSIAHMGVIVLGVFSMSIEGISGAIFLMISHGVISGGLFMLIGFLYERRHTKILSEFGGIAKTMPIYATLFCIVLLGSIGLPLTMGFPGEFLSLLGIFKVNPIYAFLGGFGIIMGAIYSMNLFKLTFFGPITKTENRNLKDLNISELFAIVPIVFLTIFLGIYPNLLLTNIDKSVQNSIFFMYQKTDNNTTKSYIENSNTKRSLDVK